MVASLGLSGVEWMCGRLLRLNCCELLPWEAGSWGTGPVREPIGRGRSVVGSLYQANDWWEHSTLRLCAEVNCRVCEWSIALQLLVVKTCESSINPISNPHSLHSHSYTWPFLRRIVGWLCVVSRIGRENTRSCAVPKEPSRPFQPEKWMCVCVYVRHNYLSVNGIVSFPSFTWLYNEEYKKVEMWYSDQRAEISEEICMFQPGRCQATGTWVISAETNNEELFIARQRFRNHGYIDGNNWSRRLWKESYRELRESSRRESAIYPGNAGESASIE
jgi:hypothetical protein